MVMGDGGYIQMNQDGLIDLGEFDLSQFGPTAANPNVFTSPQLPGVGQVAPVDAQGNLGAAYGAVLGMQQAIPDPGIGYEQARARRMQALMEDLGVLDQGVAAAQEQVAKQRARPMNFGNLPIGAEANALFGRAYDFAEGAIGQGRISAEAKLRAQANQALDEILSGNYRAGYQGQVQQALDIPNQALTAAGQFNQVGMANQQTDLATILEESANRRAEMSAAQAQQLAQFGEQGTDARFRLGLANSNNQLGIQEASQDKRTYFNALYQDILSKNDWFRKLPLEQQKLAVDVLQGNQNAAVQLSTNNSSVASAFQLEQLRTQNDMKLKQYEAQLKATDPSDALQLQYIQAQIANTTASTNRINAEIEAAKNGTGTLTAGQLAAMQKDQSVLDQVQPSIRAWTPVQISLTAAPTGTEPATDVYGSLAYQVLAGTPRSSADSFLGRYLEAQAAALYPPTNAKDPKKDTNAAPRKAYIAEQKAAAKVQLDAMTGAGLSAAAREQLRQLYVTRVQEYQKSPEYLQAEAQRKAINFTAGAPTPRKK